MEGQDFDPWLEAMVWAAPQGTGGRPSHLGILPPALLAEMGNLVSTDASVQGRCEWGFLAHCVKAGSRPSENLSSPFMVPQFSK